MVGLRSVETKSAGRFALLGLLSLVSAQGCASTGSGDLPDGTELPASMQVPFDEAPRLLNAPEVRQVLQGEYAQWLAEEERSRQLVGRQAMPWRGRVVMHLRIGASGETLETRVVRGTGRVEVDRAALRAASVMRWRPAMFEGEPTDIWYVHQFRF